MSARIIGHPVDDFFSVNADGAHAEAMDAVAAQEPTGFVGAEAVFPEETPGQYKANRAACQALGLLLDGAFEERFVE